MLTSLLVIAFQWSRIVNKLTGYRLSVNSECWQAYWLSPFNQFRMLTDLLVIAFQWSPTGPSSFATLTIRSWNVWVKTTPSPNVPCPGWWTKTTLNAVMSSSITLNAVSSKGLLMMTSSNGSIFHVTGPLCGEFTGDRWIPRTKASAAELWCFLWSAPE